MRRLRDLLVLVRLSIVELNSYTRRPLSRKGLLNVRISYERHLAHELLQRSMNVANEMLPEGVALATVLA